MPDPICVTLRRQWPMLARAASCAEWKSLVYSCFLEPNCLRLIIMVHCQSCKLFRVLRTKKDSRFCYAGMFASRCFFYFIYMFNRQLGVRGKSEYTCSHKHTLSSFKPVIAARLNQVVLGREGRIWWNFIRAILSCRSKCLLKRSNQFSYWRECLSGAQPKAETSASLQATSKCQQCVLL